MDKQDRLFVCDLDKAWQHYLHDLMDEIRWLHKAVDESEKLLDLLDPSIEAPCDEAMMAKARTYIEIARKRHAENTARHTR